MGEAGGLLHHVRLGVQGGLGLLTVEGASGVRPLRHRVTRVAAFCLSHATVPTFPNMPWPCASCACGPASHVLCAHVPLQVMCFARMCHCKSCATYWRCSVFKHSGDSCIRSTLLKTSKYFPQNFGYP